MPQLKARSGTSPSVRGCIAYLTRGGRALAADFINCCEVDGSGREVWKQMDDTRRLFGNDVPARSGNGRVRTFEHLIVSPDPRDDVDLATLQQLVTTWARKYFGDYQVAIYYHDDNRGEIPHAHIVVNNTNLSDGRRLAPKLTAGAFRRMGDDLQDMAAGLGLRAFGRTGGDGEVKPGKASRRVARDARTREELAIIAEGGYSWKEDIRQRTACAVKLSRSVPEFLESCSALGLAVRENKRGEWVFSLAGGEARQVSGGRLGTEYSRLGLGHWLATERSSKRPKIGFEAAERMRAAIAPMAAAGGPTPSVLGVIDGRKYTVKDVADMLDLCEELDIRSMDDFRSAAADQMEEPARRKLENSRLLAKSLGHLPEHRPKHRERHSGPRHCAYGFASSPMSRPSYTPSYPAPAPTHSYVGIGER